MGFLAVVHLRELLCPECGARVADPGARSFVVDAAGDPVGFEEQDPPAELTLELHCPQGHPVELLVPNEIAAEDVSVTPDEAPLAVDAALLSGTRESGRPF